MQAEQARDAACSAEAAWRAHSEEVIVWRARVADAEAATSSVRAEGARLDVELRAARAGVPWSPAAEEVGACTRSC